MLKKRNNLFKKIYNLKLKYKKSRLEQNKNQSIAFTREVNSILQLIREWSPEDQSANMAETFVAFKAINKVISSMEEILMIQKGTQITLEGGKISRLEKKCCKRKKNHCLGLKSPHSYFCLIPTVSIPLSRPLLENLQVTFSFYLQVISFFLFPFLFFFFSFCPVKSLIVMETNRKKHLHCRNFFHGKYCQYLHI